MSPPSADKACKRCGTRNPGSANFCLQCGKAFAGGASPMPAPQVSPQADPDAGPEEQGLQGLWGRTGEIPLDPSAILRPEPAGDAGIFGGPDPSDELPFGLSMEARPPFPVSLLVELGPLAGRRFSLARLETTLGGRGATIELPDDPALDWVEATLLYHEEELVLRDEGRAGIFLRLRTAAPLEPGDQLLLGDHLFRYDGWIDLPPPEAGAAIGAPRPADGRAVRLVELLDSGRTGRVCLRWGAGFTVGRGACDAPFPNDAKMAQRHAEFRLAPDKAVVSDLGGDGVYLRVRPHEPSLLQPNDELRLGRSWLRVEFGD